MYSSNTSEHQKSSSPTPSAPPDPFRQAPAIGIHVKPVNQFPNDNSHAAHPIHPQANTIPWSSGLCDCGADVPNCCMTCWCPCITFGQISDIVDKGSQSCVANGAIYAAIMYFTGCCCIYSCLYRSKLRKQYSLMESPCSDCLVHCCCQTCALCQEYRELKSRGFDMTIGWEGNMERQNHGVAVAPIVHGGMNR